MATLAHALLAQLLREPATGYALSKAMGDPVGFFWKAEHSQIYPELARMRELGWVGMVESRGPGPRPKRTYHLTAEGRDELRTWALSPMGDQRDFALRVYASQVLTDDELLALVAGERERHRAQLDFYEGRLAAAQAPALDDPRYGGWALLHVGASFERHVLGWLDWLETDVTSRRP